MMKERHGTRCGRLTTNEKYSCKFTFSASVRIFSSLKILGDIAYTFN